MYTQLKKAKKKKLGTLGSKCKRKLALEKMVKDYNSLEHQLLLLIY